MEIEINDLLCYVTTALDSIDNDSIVKTCVAFYGAGKIKDAKQRIATFLSEEIKWRRGDDRIKADMQDLMDMIRFAQQKGRILPKFVAESFNSLPPSSGFDIVGEGLISLIDEVSKLREEVVHLKSLRVSDGNILSDLTCVKEALYEIRKEVNEIKNDKNDLKKVNAFETGDEKQSLCSQNFPSAPPASQVLSQFEDGLEDNFSDVQLNSDSDLRNWAEIVSDVSSNKVNRDMKVYSNSGMDTQLEKVSNNRLVKTVMNKKTSSLNVNNDKNNDGFIKVKNRRKKPVIFGKKVSDQTDKFKCAKSFVDLYIGRCDSNVVGDDIVDFIKSNLNYDINKIEELKCRNPTSKSFKLNVEVTVREKLLTEDFWPRGIICRKFYSNRNYGANN